MGYRGELLFFTFSVSIVKKRKVSTDSKGEDEDFIDNQKEKHVKLDSNTSSSPHIVTTNAKYVMLFFFSIRIMSLIPDTNHAPHLFY